MQSEHPGPYDKSTELAFSVNPDERIGNATTYKDLHSMRHIL